MAGAGALLMIAYEGAFFTMSLHGNAPVTSGRPDLVMLVALTVAVCALAVGATVPDWGPRVLQVLRAWAALYRLRPMWRQLTAAVPRVVLPRERLLASPRWALCRCVVEIRDAELTLRGYEFTRQELECLAATVGLDPSDPVLVESAALAAGLRGRSYALPRQAISTPVQGGATLDEEVAHLIPVARLLPAATRALRVAPQAGALQPE